MPRQDDRRLGRHHRQEPEAAGRVHDAAVFTLALSRDGKTLASASEDGTVRLWDVARWRTIRTIRVSEEREVMGLAFSPDDRWIVTGDYDSLAKLYQVSTGRELMRYEGHRAAVRSPRSRPTAGRSSRPATTSRPGSGTSGAAAS